MRRSTKNQQTFTNVYTWYADLKISTVKKADQFIRFLTGKIVDYLADVGGASGYDRSRYVRGVCVVRERGV